MMDTCSSSNWVSVSGIFGRKGEEGQKGRRGSIGPKGQPGASGIPGQTGTGLCSVVRFTGGGAKVL